MYFGSYFVLVGFALRGLVLRFPKTMTALILVALYYCLR
jgi:hypothetical protein